MPYRTIAFLIVLLLVLLGLWWLARTTLDRAARRSVLRFRSRVDRFKLTKKHTIVAALLADEVIARAVDEHTREHGASADETWLRVRRYLDEIIPFFNILAYYRLGYAASRTVLNFFYKVSVDAVRPDPFKGLPRDSIIIYLMNHRSNADYVLVAYALAGDVSISYAVGEWARAFPLEHIFKSFGSYFIRRRYREPLYHVVLERYVQLITMNGVTQGIFPEGGLTRDGRLRPAKIGLLDYALGVAREPHLRSRMFVMPVAISYDRVIEDRTLIRELAARDGRPHSTRWEQLREVASYLGWNVGRILTGRWRRYGRAAVMVGTPISVGDWIDGLERDGISLFALERHERLGHVQRFCDMSMDRIGDLVPVTPVALACAALQTFPADFVSRTQLLSRMEELRGVLPEVNARVLQGERTIEEVFERAYRMLRMRKVIAREGGGYLVLPRGRALVSYYANGIAHLLGPFADGVRERDALPVLAATGEW
ncbi:MAG: 1-acyl-sn-glycerol-3-phosphate acyltransferase [Gemmatimonadaceae bacterium]|nr:1-acyl-sn-glycerol-3-phosphate acyltransferase [Gemmatimonadaceae bacterium]